MLFAAISSATKCYCLLFLQDVVDNNTTMVENDDYIRSLAEQMAQQRRADLDEETAARGQQRAAEERWRAEEERNQRQVTQLCGRFAVWAVRNRIPYDCPTPFANGWILGSTSGRPGYSSGHQGITVSGASEVALLVTKRKRIRELVVNSATRPGGGYHLFPRAADLRHFPIGTIYTSIASFSYRYGVEWDD